MRSGASPAITQVVATLLDNLGTDFSRVAAKHVRAGQWDRIPKRIDPSSYESSTNGAMQFRDDYQVVELVRKRTFGGTTSATQRRNAALASWQESERKNYRTNQRLSLWMNNTPAHEQGSPSSAAIESFLSCVKNEIRRVIGRVPREIGGRFSSGTNEGPTRVYHTIVHKLLQPSCTPQLARRLSYVTDDFGTAKELDGFKGRLSIPQAWEKALLEVGISINQLPLSRGEGFGTVSKNYDTDRTIGKQPVVNLFFQLGVGEIFRKALLKYAYIDLNYGHLEHSRLAMLGSISNRDATIDLRNASNSLCYVLVELLFDNEWFDLLSLLRCDSARIGKKWQKLEMFSAMGNGFTFELQTLIFWAVCRACGVIEPKVFGDDIIVPTEFAKPVMAALKFLGFDTNPDKTFVDGPFRESCGGNFFMGVDVTPVRITEDPKTPLDWFTIHNQLYRLGARFAKAKRLALEQIPVELRKYGGPVELGDIVLHGRPCVRRWRGQVGYIKCVRPLPIKWMWRRMFDGWDCSHLQMAVALLGTSSGSANQSRRDSERSLRHITHQKSGSVTKAFDPKKDTRVTPHFFTSRGVSGWKVGRVVWSGDALLRASGDGFHLHG